MEKELRYFRTELRAVGDRLISGTAIVFNSESRDLGGFTEIIKPESVTREFINRCDIVLLVNHNDRQVPLARSKNGTGSLAITIDSIGVHFSAKIRSTSAGDEILAAVRSKDLDACSFAFAVAKNGDTWAKRTDGTYLRTITKFEEIMDFSVVTTPAYTATVCRSFERFRQAQPPVPAPAPVDYKQYDDTIEKLSQLPTVHTKQNNTMENNYGIFASLRDANIGKTVSLPLEIRSILAANATGSGQEVTGEDKLNLVAALRSKLVLTQAGATLIPNCKGTVSVAKYGGTVVDWALENDEAADGAGTFSDTTLTPKRITALIKVSIDLLNQDSAEAEKLFVNDLMQAVAGKLEATILGKDAAITNKRPVGLFYAAPTIKGAASWTNITDMEKAVDLSNGIGNCSYITNATGRNILRTTTKISGGSPIIEPDGTINGYKLLVTNNVTGGLQTAADEQGILFGDFSHLIIAQWGTIDLTVDKYTGAYEGYIKLVVNAYFDYCLRHSGAVQTGSLK